MLHKSFSYLYIHTTIPGIITFHTRQRFGLDWIGLDDMSNCPNNESHAVPQIGVAENLKHEQPVVTVDRSSVYQKSERGFAWCRFNMS